MRQEDLAIAAGVSIPYISNLERDFSANTRSGKPRASEEMCKKLSRALGVTLDEVRVSAGYAPMSMSSGKPQTLAELIETLERMGIENIHFADHDKLQDATPEELQEVLDAVKFAIEITISRQRKELLPPSDNYRGQSLR